jgi:hypothetical protein
MEPQVYEWTCSVCSFTWVINSLNDSSKQVPSITREEAAQVIGYPHCVNETYGCMSSQCLIDAFATFGLDAVEAHVTFDQAYAIMGAHTGTINPQGMYHFMACRGLDGGNLWVANSAPGYRGVWDSLTRDAFNALGPVSIIYLPKSAKG